MAPKKILKNCQFLIITCIFIFLQCQLTLASQIIPPKLLASLEVGKRVDVFVSFKGGIESPLKAAITRRHRDAGDNFRIRRLELLRESLIENAEFSQRNVNFLLTRRRSNDNVTMAAPKFKSFWITNQMLIEKADLAILQQVVKDPQVSEIQEEGAVFLITAELGHQAETRQLGNYTVPWGIKKIQAPQAWSHIAPSSAGEGVIVATIDTGVRHTHETLSSNFLGDYGWYDPSGSQNTPFDSLGHGTHVTGILAGTLGIGVVPGAKWATCALCSKTLKCLPRYTLDCGQFFVCPTLPDGTHPNCSKTPRVISNAWGTPEVQQWTDMIRVWHAANIIPVFALGNGGPTCASSYFPGNHSEVIAVGNTNVADILNSTSSVGPTSDGRVKPDIVAPGTDILSASVFGDDEYHVATGTSMSAPHVAGTIALLLAKQPTLTFEQVKTILFQSAERKGLTFGEEACRMGNVTAFPNNLFGHGRLNAFRALQKAINVEGL